MTVKDFFRFNLKEVVIDVVLILYTRFLLIPILSKRESITDIISASHLSLLMIALLFFTIWYMVLIVKSYSEGGIKFFPTIFGIFFFCIAIVMIMEGPGLIAPLLKREGVESGYGTIGGGLVASIAGIALGIVTPLLKEKIVDRIEDKIFRDSLILSLQLVFTAIVVVLWCFYDQLLLRYFVDHAKQTVAGMIMFMIISGLFPVRLIIMFKPPISPASVLTGAAAICYYISSAIASLPAVH